MRRFSPNVAPVLWLTAGAVALRLVLFLGRGDYVAFDEAWYLVLGHNLWSGRGYTVSGLQHVALSPLFPIVAGAFGRVLGNLVWGGRVVAAVAGGLLVVPCWSIFQRLGGRRTALLASAFVAALPSLAPFVAPEFVGWDLWVGAGPLCHLFLFGGLALLLGTLRVARTPLELARWALAGGAFGLAFLDRPEAILAAALMVALALALYPGRGRRLVGAGVCALAFLLVTGPYFLRLHAVLGRWALSGRAVAVGTDAVRVARQDLAAGGGTVETMLWEGKDRPYAQALYALDSTRTRMADPYWGVAPRSAPGVAPRPAVVRPAGHRAPVAPAAPSALTSAGRAEPPRPRLLATALHRVGLYARALGMVLPWLLWPLALGGMLAPARRRARAELVLAVPLAVTSMAVALLVAIDPRTQLLLAPLLAWYTARGVHLFAGVAERRTGPELRRDFLSLVLGGAVVLLLLGIDARRLWLGVQGEDVRELIGSANREVGTSLQRLVAPGETVMGWSPVPAVWAGRDWRPLPTAPLPDILTFAEATDTRWIVFSTLNPSPLPREQMPRAFLIARILPGSASADHWRVRIESIAGQHAVGELGPGVRKGGS